MNNWYLLAAIPVFGLLVLVHEFGHFITAKWAGIRVEEFGLGFPPRLLGFRKRDGKGWEVIWFGGRRSEEDSYGSLKQTPFSGTSGGVSAPGVPASNHTIYSLNLIPIGGFVRMPGENGDINDESGNYDPQSFAAKSAGKRLIVLVAGVTMNVLLAMVLFTFAFGFGEPKLLPQIGKVTPRSPAQIAGIHPGDTIVSANHQPVKFFADLQAIVTAEILADKNQHETVPVALQIRRPGSSGLISTTVNVREHPPSGQGPMGIEASGKVVFDSIPLWQAPIRGVQYTFQTTSDFLHAIGQMITGALPVQLAGPVGIVNITGQVAQSIPTEGWWPILSLTAVLSLNLAIINILPFPALDGGRIVLVLVEVLRGGKRLKPEVEGVINFAGMLMLLTLMVVITFFDVKNLLP
ncbi:MAG TPA: site-2 protease family protein [Ktedonobacteraceae bacterium]|nr:site-2 protease family protein [Ktedonobacteraceae bacterium]